MKCGNVHYPIEGVTDPEVVSALYNKIQSLFHNSCSVVKNQWTDQDEINEPDSLLIMKVALFIHKRDKS